MVVLVWRAQEQQSIADTLYGTPLPYFKGENVLMVSDFPF